MNKKSLIIILALGIFCIMPVFAITQLDSDNDGLSNYDELNKYYTDPNNSDTDQDSYNDGLEIANNYSPRHGEAQRLITVDSDKDYLNDAWELIIGTDLMDPDSDGDLLLDGTEVAASDNPLDKDNRSKLNKLIKVSLEEQSLSYYFDNKKLDSFLISSGLSYMPTPAGEFEVLGKYPIKHYGGAGFDYPNTKWNLHFTTGKYKYYIHGAYWHDNFGQPMSHGCVNVSYDHMEPLYWFTQIGTKVVIE